MNVLSGVVGMVAVMLAAGGVSKALAPDPTVASFRAVGLPGRRGLVRVLAVVEVVLGLGLIVVGTPLAGHPGRRRVHGLHRHQRPAAGPG